MGAIRPGFIWVGLVVIGITSCAVLTQPNAGAMGNIELCRAAATKPYHLHADWPRNSFEQEVVNRGLVQEWEITSAKTKKITVGMSECALLLAWGMPYRVNRSADAKQYVYQGKYVYIEKDLVSSWE